MLTLGLYFLLKQLLLLSIASANFIMYAKVSKGAFINHVTTKGGWNFPKIGYVIGAKVSTLGGPKSPKRWLHGLCMAPKSIAYANFSAPKIQSLRSYKVVI